MLVVWDEWCLRLPIVETVSETREEQRRPGDWLFPSGTSSNHEFRWRQGEKSIALLCTIPDILNSYKVNFVVTLFEIKQNPYMSIMLNTRSCFSKLDEKNSSVSFFFDAFKSV